MGGSSAPGGGAATRRTIPDIPLAVGRVVLPFIKAIPAALTTFQANRYIPLCNMPGGGGGGGGWWWW